LLVRGVTETSDGNNNDPSRPTAKKLPEKAVPLVKLDPAHAITLNTAKVAIPDPSHQIDTLLGARQREHTVEENDEEDLSVFQHKTVIPEVIEIDDNEEGGFFDNDDDYHISATKPLASSKDKAKAKEIKGTASKDDWTHDPKWVTDIVAQLMPPPLEASPSATMAVQRELAAMLKEQDNAKSMKELGWYMPPELIGDNLFQWIVEMHSFDETIPIAKDLKQKWVFSSR
jgi:ubiquitin-conjugating enzyme E2 Q